MKEAVTKKRSSSQSESESCSDDEDAQVETMKVAKKLIQKRKPLFEDDLQLQAGRKKSHKKKAEKRQQRDELEGSEQSDWNDDERNHDQ